MKRRPIVRLVIKRIATERRIPIAAAAHACMSIARKNALCKREARRTALTLAPKDSA